MPEPATKEIDKRLAALSSEMRAALEDLRKKIHAAAPEAVESISYGLPAFRYKSRPLVCFMASTNHCGFYVMSPAVMEKYKELLKDYDTSKGTIRFLADKPLPASLVKTIVKARLEEIDAGVKY